MKHLEAAQQQQVIEWSKWAYKSKPTQYPMLNMLHCSLNGVKLSGTQAKIAKGQGMLSGVPDLFLPVPKNGFLPRIEQLGWSAVEALETHLRLQNFADDWDAPGMEAYDDLSWAFY